MRTRVCLGLLALLLCGNSFACAGGCTDIGCLTFVQVELIFPSEIDVNAVEVTVQQDGESFVCEPGSDRDPCHQGFRADFFPGAEPEEGAFTIVLNEAPEALELEVTTPSGTETVTLRPEYSRSQPNGPGCPSTCYASTNRLELGL